jgi:hypothetical protein
MNVLFIGNSYTFCNRMPWMLSTLAAAAEPPHNIAVDMVAEGGRSLAWHVENAATLEAIRKGGWDTVVLQDHSLGPIWHRGRTLGATRTLDAEVRKAGARTVLYMTWAREHLPEMHGKLTRAYREFANELGAVVAPVGLAWHRALVAGPELPLFTDDGSHPTPTGSYLIACVFYATLTGASPVGLPAGVSGDDGEIVRLDAACARTLQTCAWKTVSTEVK